MLPRSKLQYHKDGKASKYGHFLMRGVCSIFCTSRLYNLVFVAVVSAVVSVGMYWSFERSGFMKRKVADYLLQDPDIVINPLEKKRSDIIATQEEARRNVPQKVKELLSEISSTKNFIGNPSGKDLIVVFYDYGCHYCHNLATTLKPLLSANKNMKIILKELPMMRKFSVLAANASLYVAERHHSKLANFHFGLMERAKESMKKKAARGGDDEILGKEDILFVANKLGIDAKEIKNVLESDRYKDIINTNYQQAGNIMLTGTPALIINGVLYSGAMPAQQIEESIVSNRGR